MTAPRDSDENLKAAVRLHRIEPLPPRIDLGEQVVGSDQWFEVAVPKVIDGFDGAGIMIGAIEPIARAGGPRCAGPHPLIDPGAVVETGSHAFRPDFRPRAIGEHATEPVRVRFAPGASGPYDSQLQLDMQWSDGTRGHQTVQLHASARNLTDVPADARMTSHEAKSVEHAEGPIASSHASAPPESLAALTTAANVARSAASSLARKQQLGVHVAEQEAASFVAALPPAPWWHDLVKLAVSMGVAGVAGAVGRSLALGLAQQLSASVTKDDRVVIGLTDLLKDGLKSTIKETLPALAARPAADRPAAGADEFSSNVRVDFFARQSDLLGGIADANGDAISTSETALQALLASDPQLAVNAMHAITASLRDATLHHAVQEQTLASETQWLTGIARAQLNARSEPRTAPTNLQNAISARPWHDARGVLELRVRLPHRTQLAAMTGQTPALELAGIAVSGATISGVAQEIADRLDREVLATLPIPIILVVQTGDGEAFITRDEAGRIRVHGSLPIGDQPGGQSEPQMISTATRLLAHVTSRSLAEWGVSKVGTNDATGNGDAP